MAYSRWSNSRWFTYWVAIDEYDRDKQLFDISAMKVFSYRELKDDIEGCLKTVRVLDPDASEEEYEELRGYMQEFLKDIEADKNINHYEELKRGLVSDALLQWSMGLDLEREKDLNKAVNEALKVLSADKENLPLLMGEVETDLGRALLEKRFKGDIVQYGGVA